MGPTSLSLEEASMEGRTPGCTKWFTLNWLDCARKARLSGTKPKSAKKENACASSSEEVVKQIQDLQGPVTDVESRGC